MRSDSSQQATAVLLAEEVWGSALHAMRSLAACGAPVLVAVAGDGASIFEASRSCTAAIDVPSTDPTRFCRQVRDWVLQHTGPDRSVVIIPLSDRLVDYLHRCRDEFPASFALAIPDREITAALLDKRCSLGIAERAGLDVPSWQSLPGESPSDVQQLLARSRVAVRPARWLPPDSSYLKVATADGPEVLQEIVDAWPDDLPPLVAQRYIEAPDDAVEFAILWRSGDRKTTVVCTGRKRRQSSPDGGVMLWGEATPLPDVVVGACTFLDASGFTGLGGIEFIRTPDGLHFIEFNPRLEAIHFVASEAGVDTVAMAFEEMAFDRNPHTVPRQHPAAAWVGSAWLERIRSDGTYRRTAIRDWLDFRRVPRRARAVWSWRDPGPGLRVLSRLAWRAVRSLWRSRP